MPDERQGCVWVHRLLVRPTPTSAPFSLSHHDATASFHAYLFFPHESPCFHFDFLLSLRNRSWLLSIIPSAVCPHFSDLSLDADRKKFDN